MGVTVGFSATVFTALLALLVISAALLSATSAFALSGTTIKVGSPFEDLSPTPSVAVDSAGTAYVAWIDEEQFRQHRRHRSVLQARPRRNRLRGRRHAHPRGWL